MSQEQTCETCGAVLDAEATLCLHCGAPGPAGAAGGDEVYRETGFRAQALPVAAGDVLSGRFRLVRALGRGGMGVVWLASDEELDGQHVALKVLRPEIAADSGGVADMKREVIITRELRHPYIVGVYDHHTEGERVFITMAYVDGPSLADALTARDRKPYTLEEVLPWARQVAEALDYAHGRGVLHRDVKPGNILLARDGTAHLTDFGIARMARDTLSRRTGHTASGTLAYMSPQQLLDQKAHRNDPRNDVYSFAAMLYELLSGDPPFTSGGIEAQIALKQPDPIENVPDYVNEAVLQGLAKEVTQRPENCAALVHVLSGDAAREAAALREQEEARKRADEERQREEQVPRAAEGAARNTTQANEEEKKAREESERLEVIQPPYLIDNTWARIMIAIVSIPIAGHLFRSNTVDWIVGPLAFFLAFFGKSAWETWMSAKWHKVQRIERFGKDAEEAARSRLIDDFGEKYGWPVLTAIPVVAVVIWGIFWFQEDFVWKDRPTIGALVGIFMVCGLCASFSLLGFCTVRWHFGDPKERAAQVEAVSNEKR